MASVLLKACRNGSVTCLVHLGVAPSGYSRSVHEIRPGGDGPHERRQGDAGGSRIFGSAFDRRVRHPKAARRYLYARGKWPLLFPWPPTPISRVLAARTSRDRRSRLTSHSFEFLANVGGLAGASTLTVLSFSRMRTRLADARHFEAVTNP